MGPVRTQTAGPAPNGRRLSSVLFIWLTAIAFVTFLVAALGYAKLKLEQRVRDQISAIASLAADRAAMTFDMSNRLLSSLVEEITTDDLLDKADLSVAGRARLRSTLARHQERNPGIMSLAVVNTDGTVLATATGNGVGAHLDDEPYLRTLRSGPADKPVFSQASTDPLSGIRAVRMARRIETADGRPIGFVVAGIELEKSLVSFCQSLAFSSHDLIALRNMDNGLLAGYPTDKDPFADGNGESAVDNAIAAGQVAGVSYVRSSIDGISRLVAYRKLARYPLYMTYGKDVQDLLTMWRYQTVMILLAALFAFIASTAVTLAIRRRNVLTAQLETVRGHLVDSNSALRAALAASEMVAARDQLTGLWNRRTFDHRLQEAVAHFDRHDGTFSLLLLDLDHFKDINDQHGHVAGDEVLKRFADVLHERLRQNDVDARWGGEEFVVLADGARLEAAFALAEHVRQAVENTVFGGPAHVTVSIGIAEYQPGESGDSLLARADDALYEAKRTGRNCVVAASGLTHGERFFSGTAAPAPLFAEDFA
jgi:diguanylate cyclase (GGDEF)-like protein